MQSRRATQADAMDEDSDGSGRHASQTSPPATSAESPSQPPPGALRAPSAAAPTPVSARPPASASASLLDSPAIASSLNAGSVAPSKRRRGLGVVTPTACTECRKKRAKCDGQKPCGRCKAQKDIECVYEVPVRQSKDTLRTEIELLRRQQRSSDHIFAALAHPELWEGVLQRLRAGQGIEIIADWIGRAKPPPGTAGPSGGGGGSGSGGGASGALAAFGRSNPSQVMTISALTGFTPSPHAPYAPGGHVPSQAPRHDADPNSPWSGPFSANSQTMSTRSNSHPDGMSWSSDARGRQPQSRVGSWVETQDQGRAEAQRHQRDVQQGEGAERVLAAAEGQTEIPEMSVPAGAWTDITSDSRLVQHLLALYFCWEYPTFASLSKEHFLEDFRQGHHRYCSPILVNALLALGCRFSSKPSTRAVPDDPYTSGDHFFKECQRLFYLEDNHHTLTTIQALGIMSIREASCGRDSESWYYAGQSIRLAIEMGLHRIHDDGGDEDEIAVQSATFWGAFALDHAWSLATGSLPQCSCFPHLPPKPGIIEDIEASLWIPYTDDGAPLQRSCEQPSNVRSVYKCFCELSELVHQSLYLLHSPGRPLTSRDLLSIYTQYLNWYDRIPEVLRLGHNFTPAVLFAHMYYHFAILLLFRPLIKLRIIGSSISPRDVCCQAADAIQGLLRSYSQLYTLRRTPSFVPYFVLTSSITHLAIGASAPPFDSSSSAATPGSGQPSGPLTGAVAPPLPGGHQQQASQQKQQQPQSQTQPQEREPERLQAQLQRQQHQHQQQQQQQQPPPSGSESGGDSQPQRSMGETQPKLPPNVIDAISRGIADLTEMAPCHHFALQALNILRYLAKKWNIEVNLDDANKSAADEDQDVERTVRPVTSSLNFFAPNVQEADFVCTWGVGPDSGGGVGSRVKAETDADVGPEAGVGRLAISSGALENPLFWPFPMQGRPMLPTGPQLEEAGFAML